MNINPYLLARLYAIQAAFEQSGYKSAYSTPNGKSTAAPKATPIDWEALLKTTDDESGSGGGGTIKGLRGKNAEAAKAAMRRLGRK